MDRLNADGDFGYETGSYDDSDVSTGELLSPSARDEQKSILSPSAEENTSYSCASAEQRPLLITEDGGISSTTAGRSLEWKQYDHLSAVDSHSKGDCASYTYAGDEFRPLIITEEGGIAGPVPEGKTGMSRESIRQIKDEDSVESERLLPQKRIPLQYEEVEVVDGSYDRSNVKFATTANERSDRDLVIAPSNDVYATVQKKSKEGRSAQECGDRVLQESDTQQCYAAEQKQTSSPQRPTVELADIPPSLPGKRKDSSMYEAITGELQNMIMACDEVQVDDKSLTSNSNETKMLDGERKVPPPIPKPYAGPGVGVLEQRKLTPKGSPCNLEQEGLYSIVILYCIRNFI